MGPDRRLAPRYVGKKRVGSTYVAFGESASRVGGKLINALMDSTAHVWRLATRLRPQQVARVQENSHPSHGGPGVQLKLLYLQRLALHEVGFKV